MNKKDNSLLMQDSENLELIKFPITTSAFRWTSSSIVLCLVLQIVSFLIPSVMILTFYHVALHSNITSNWWRIIFLFIDVMVWWGLYLLISLFIGKLLLITLELIHTPKEGAFKIGKKNNDYYFYCLRTSVKKTIFWIWHNFCFPWASNLAFKVCKIRADFKSTMFDGWSDLEFIEYGNNIMIGQGAVILSHMIFRDHLLIKKVIVGDHVVIGANSVVAPGTVIGKGATLGVWACTHIGQVLEPDWIYVGKPARKYKLASEMYEESKKETEKGTVRRLVDTNEKVSYRVKRYIKKDMVATAIEQLDKLYVKWKETETKRNKKELEKRYKKNKKEIKREEKKKFLI